MACCAISASAASTRITQGTRRASAIRAGVTSPNDEVDGEISPRSARIEADC